VYQANISAILCGPFLWPANHSFTGWGDWLIVVLWICLSFAECSPIFTLIKTHEETLHLSYTTELQNLDALCVSWSWCYSKPNASTLMIWIPWHADIAGIEVANTTISCTIHKDTWNSNIISL
jgi:hypothetical protein